MAIVKHVDEKILTPLDGVELSPETIGKHYAKPIRGFAVITNERTGEVLDTPNLVLLSGREFLAQKLSDTAGSSLLPAGELDLTQFKIKYFGVGTGGADTSNQPNKIGPFDDELDLRLPGKFADVGIATDTSSNLNERYQYLHDGRLKKIQSDGGTVEIVQESHNIVVNGGSGETDITVEAYTTIKYTMMIRADELYKEVDESGPFAFNEAALYTVEYELDDSGVYSIPAKADGTTTHSRYVANYRTFARFTTLTKWLEVSDALRIEWYILV